MENNKFILDLLLKALDFYGKKDNYIRTITDDDTDKAFFLPSPIEEDEGSTARETIRNIKEILLDGE